MRATYEEYSQRYRHVVMERQDGILEVRLHSDGGPLVWGARPHEELGYCFTEIGSDRDNRVIVLTGTGEKFIADLDDSWVGPMTPEKWDRIWTNGKRLLRSLLDIEVPVVAAVNGPASVHAELALLSDVVLMSRTAYFSDAPHFRHGTVPGDGVHVLWPLLLGMNRGRRFLLSGERVDAAEARSLGLVAEVVEPHDLREAAWAQARQLARQPDVILRATREIFTQQLKRLVLDHVGYGLALEGLGAYKTWPTGEEAS